MPALPLTDVPICCGTTRTMPLRDKGRGNCSSGLREKDRTFLTEKDHVASLLPVVLWLPRMPRADLEHYPKRIQPCQAFDVGGQGINVDFLNQQRARI